MPIFRCDSFSLIHTQICVKTKSHFTVRLYACKVLWFRDKRVSQECCRRLKYYRREYCVNGWTVPKLLQDHRKWRYHVSSKHCSYSPHDTASHNIIIYNTYDPNQSMKINWTHFNPLRLRLSGTKQYYVTAWIIFDIISLRHMWMDSCKKH